MNLEEAFAKELLKKDRPDAEKAGASLEIATRMLETAQSAIDSKLYEYAIISSYTSMFHASRALLFRDGFKERSHFGLYVYIKEKYKDLIEPRLINELNSLRLERHEILYGLEQRKEVQEVEAENIISYAKDYLEAVENILENKV